MLTVMRPPQLEGGVWERGHKLTRLHTHIMQLPHHIPATRILWVRAPPRALHDNLCIRPTETDESLPQAPRRESREATLLQRLVPYPVTTFPLGEGHVGAQGDAKACGGARGI